MEFYWAHSGSNNPSGKNTPNDFPDQTHIHSLSQIFEFYYLRAQRCTQHTHCSLLARHSYLPGSSPDIRFSQSIGLSHPPFSYLDPAKWVSGIKSCKHARHASEVNTWLMPCEPISDCNRSLTPALQSQCICHTLTRRDAINISRCDQAGTATKFYSKNFRWVVMKRRFHNNPNWGAAVSSLWTQFRTSDLS